MISAMANLLDYDIYDLELTTVKDNSELRKLLIETTGKSIIVIEDIDCSLDLTGQRKKTKEKDDDDQSDKEKDPVSKKKKEAEEERKSGSKVTLSGLLNFIDGLWSACGGERIIVFTTNYVDKLDPALIRRGRMDKHIELSYCCFEAFKVLAKNYLELESHEMFGKIEELLGETKMTPADVAENLMPRSDEEDEEDCLKRLIEGLETAKEEARKKTEEEAVSKAEKADKEGGETSSQVAKENGEISAEEAKENGVIAGG
jgi:chaperone BCS1